eukprot:1855391-Pyramimonas_sp.AAC.1
MHVLDCKGVSSFVFGSMLAALVTDMRLGNNQQLRLNVINAKLDAFYTQHPGSHKLPKILPQSFKNEEGWAELRGPAFKAANTRAAAPFFASLALEYFNGDGEMHVATRQATSALVELYSLMDRSPMFMSDASLRHMREVVDDFG